MLSLSGLVILLLIVMIIVLGSWRLIVLRFRVICL